MNRSDWRFKYSSDDLRAACEKIIAHSRERLAHWQGRYEKAKVDAESQTVKAKVKTQQVTGGERAVVDYEVDRSAQRELDLSQQKIEHHTARIEEYDRWRRGFAANALAWFDLDPDDISYFEL